MSPNSLSVITIIYVATISIKSFSLALHMPSCLWPRVTNVSSYAFARCLCSLQTYGRRLGVRPLSRQHGGQLQRGMRSSLARLLGRAEPGARTEWRTRRVFEQNKRREQLGRQSELRERSFGPWRTEIHRGKCELRRGGSFLQRKTESRRRHQRPDGTIREKWTDLGPSRKRVGWER